MHNTYICVCMYLCGVCIYIYMYTYVYMARFMPTNPKAGWENLPYFQILFLGGCCVVGRTMLHQ